MKTNLCIVSLLTILALNLNAQLVVPTQDELQRFLKTKTIIFLEDNPLLNYNQKIQETAKKHWKITPYEFMTFNEKVFDSLRFDPNLSFLMLNNVYFKRDREIAEYVFLNVTLGGNYPTVKDMPTISGLPISYANVDESTYDYKLGLILRFIEQHVHNLMNNPKIKSSKRALKFYSENRKKIHNKTLYLRAEELTAEVNTVAKIKKYYPYKVKIATPEEIEAVVDKYDSEAVILHQVAPMKDHKKARCWNVILGADDAALYYFGWFHIKKGKQAQGMRAIDFKKLAK